MCVIFFSLNEKFSQVNFAHSLNNKSHENDAQNYAKLLIVLKIEKSLKFFGIIFSKKSFKNQ
jgi:hypothetical protein